MSVDLAKLIVDLNKEEVIEEVKRRTQAGEDILRILEDCRQGMTIVGEKFQKGETFLAELMLSADIFKEVLSILEPYMEKASSGKKIGKVIMATMQGDIHDLGKGIVVTLLKARGFEVYDMGVDVAPEVIIEKVKEIRPDFVGFSSLLTTTLPIMKKTVDMLAAEGLKDNLKVMLGGGVTTAMTKEFVGADFQTLDAMDAVDYCLQIMGGEQYGN